MYYLAEAAILSISSFLEIAKDVASPLLAFINSFTIHSLKLLFDFEVPCVAPFARFLIDVSSLLLGDESTAFG